MEPLEANKKNQFTPKARELLFRLLGGGESNT